MEARVQVEFIGCPAPHYLAVGIVQGDSVHSAPHPSLEFERELDNHLVQSCNGIRRACSGINDLPVQKFSSRPVSGTVRERLLTVVAHRRLIGVHDLGSAAFLANMAGVEPDGARTEPPNLSHMVAYEDDGAAMARYVAHFTQALFLKGDIAHGQDFIDKQNFRLEMRGDGKGETHLHAAAVVLQGSIEEAFHFGEGYDFVELAADFRCAHAQHGAAHEHIFAPGELGVETGADFEKAADAAAKLGVAFGGTGDPRQDFQKRALASAIAPD